MARYVIPKNFRAEDRDLLGALEEVARNSDLPVEEAKSVFDLLPPAVQQAPGFNDKLTGIWRYEFGLPYSVGKGKAKTQVIGTNIAHKVSVLFHGLRILRGLVSNSQLSLFCKRLADKNKHLDHLSELDPILRPRTSFKADYEPTGFAKGNRKVDWHISFSDNSSCLLAVKHRYRALISNMGEIGPRLSSGEKPFPAEPPLPEGIFQDSQEKFVPIVGNRWQGIWILTDTYYDDAALKTDFDSLDVTRIQFAVLTHFEGDARILARNNLLKNWIKEKFCLVEMRRRGPGS